MPAGLSPRTLPKKILPPGKGRKNPDSRIGKRILHTAKPGLATARKVLLRTNQGFRTAKVTPLTASPSSGAARKVLLRTNQDFRNAKVTLLTAKPSLAA